jgi:hypothetical protein
MRNHQPTLDYVKKRKADGKGKMEIIRCLKRFVARSTIVDFTPENHLTDIGASMPWWKQCSRRSNPN